MWSALQSFDEEYDISPPNQHSFDQLNFWNGL